MEQGGAIEHRMVTNAIERAQRKVEGHNFDIRKNLLGTTTFPTTSARLSIRSATNSWPPRISRIPWPACMQKWSTTLSANTSRLDRLRSSGI